MITHCPGCPREREASHSTELVESGISYRVYTGEFAEIPSVSVPDHTEENIKYRATTKEYTNKWYIILYVW